MALAAEDINSVFLKHFFSETMYVVPGEQLFRQTEEPAAEPVPPVVLTTASPSSTTSTPAVVSAPSEKAAAPKKFDVIGENRKGVAVLVTLPDATFQTLPQLGFLNKILAAIGLGPHDVAFVNNISGTTALFEDLTQVLDVNHIISFASRLDTALPHAKFTLYNPVVVDQVPIIFSQSLAVLDKDPEQKKLLWNALRQVFL
ncbi:hypothetical protein FVR03_08860 [Pontibacter qinzhouensis]|uniref:Uncharacterized protein n=1 Tax=Pontibacter qinzhouensis TaxID=2603253 RepID=A0A5C8K6W2_9BACT|nr:hypothetical protein [Pontibacter qinzhouensis]TXK47646.1 hypothetical protein FVR03_08860 [Pontibacter qinzhouensis]